MAYHHFEDVQATTTLLASFLKPCGKLFVADSMPYNMDALKQSGLAKDLMPAGLTFEQAEASITHKAGFSEETMKGMFEAAGLKFKWVPKVATLEHPESGQTMRVFLAIGTKDAAA